MWGRGNSGLRQTRISFLALLRTSWRPLGRLLNISFLIYEMRAVKTFLVHYLRGSNKIIFESTQRGRAGALPLFFVSSAISVSAGVSVLHGNRGVLVEWNLVSPTLHSFLSLPPALPLPNDRTITKSLGKS